MVSDVYEFHDGNEYPDTISTKFFLHNNTISLRKN